MNPYPIYKDNVFHFATTFLTVFKRNIYVVQAPFETLNRTIIYLVNDNLTVPFVSINPCSAAPLPFKPNERNE